MNENLTYLDHAATTFPKPSEVLKRMVAQYEQMGCSPGRGGYDAAEEAEAFVLGVRKRLASFFQCSDPQRVIFAANATDALNLAIFGMIRPGTHVVSTRLEHNSVLRPLYRLKQMGCIDYTLVDFDKDGFVDPGDIAAAFRKNTSLVIINHASNVLGSVQPVEEIAGICAERNTPLLIDAAQSAGYVPIRMAAWKVSAVAFTGHKSLLGPTGIGGLAIAPEVDIASTRFGGTGLDSRNPDQPQSFPYRLEAGTLNLLGIIGLNAGLDYMDGMGMEENYRQKMALLSLLREGLSPMDGVKVYGSLSHDRHVPLLSFNISGMHPSDAGMILDGDHDIAVRTGLHCAPLVHETLGTAPGGAVRISLGWNSTQKDIDRVLEAISEMRARDSQ